MIERSPADSTTDNIVFTNKMIPFSPFILSYLGWSFLQRGDHYVWLHISQTLRGSSRASGFCGSDGRRFEEVARSGTARSRHRDHGQPLIYILSTVEPGIAALCFGMPAESEEEGALLLRRALLLVSTLVIASKIQTSVLSAEPPTSISPRALREGVGVMHSHFSNGDTLTRPSDVHDSVPRWLERFSWRKHIWFFTITMWNS